jgi:hypothetical protein
VDRVEATECVPLGEVASLFLDATGHLPEPYRFVKLGPIAQCLRVGDGFAVPRPRQPAPRDGRHGSSSRRPTRPQSAVDDEFHQGAGVQIDPSPSAFAFSYEQVGHTSFCLDSLAVARAGTKRSERRADETFFGKAIE